MKAKMHAWKWPRVGRFGPMLILAGLLFVSSGAQANVLTVPGAYPTIQAAIDAAVAGDMISVAAGTYVGQLDINKAITVQGTGAAATRIWAPAVLSEKFTVGATAYRPVVYIHDTDATLINIGVDGRSVGATNSGLVGVAFYRSGGNLTHVNVMGVRHLPMSADQDGIGVYAFNDAPLRSLTLDFLDISSYQKGGVELSGPGIQASISQSDIEGAMETGGLATPFGVRVADGAVAHVTDTQVLGNRATGAGAGPNPLTDLQSAGILLDQAGQGTLIQNSTLMLNDVGVCAHGSSSIADNLLMENRYAGLVLRGGTHDLGGCNFQGLQNTGVWVIGETALDGAELHDLCLTGPGGDGQDLTIVGVRAYSASTPLSIQVRNSTIELWNIGLKPEGANVSLTVHESAVQENAIAGYDNTASGRTQSATLNWWGDPSGPPPAGVGDAILGGNVTWDPRLLLDNDVDFTCGLQRDASVVHAVGGTGCISTPTPVKDDVAIVVERGDTTPMRGYSVTFTLSAELDLASGLASITEGTYLNGGAPPATTYFECQQIDANTYSVDCAILGLPCGPTGTPGILFDLALKKRTGASDGTGTITVTEVTLRDCDNQPIAVAPGAAFEITVDTTPPAAVADLVAAQDKSGNDGDGTTKIDVGFSVPIDAATVAVYRAPFGFYPEYDDGGGAVPTAPAYPPASPWELTTLVAPGADETSVRDFWYYAVFTWDVCGNRSAVSNITTGTLNYHLGDVAPAGPPIGDNQVGTSDISVLGGTYFAHHGDVNYNSHCDVGPTTNYTVDARPTTDNYIGFEDLMMFAINFLQVSLVGHEPAAAVEGRQEQPRVVLTLGAERVRVGGELRAVLELKGNDAIVKGLHAEVTFNPAQLEFVGADAGDLITLNGYNVFFIHGQDAKSVTVDAAMLGQNMMLHGSGAVATLTFRVLAGGGAPALAVAELRDVRNGLIAPAGATPRESQMQTGAELSPAFTTAFLGARPNPFPRATDISFSLAGEALVTVRIYDTSGRLACTLLEQTLPAGIHHVSWDGRLAGGGQATVGVYLCTFKAGDTATSRKLFLYR
jgi:hypothetical protein